MDKVLEALIQKKHHACDPNSDGSSGDFNLADPADALGLFVSGAKITSKFAAQGSAVVDASSAATSNTLLATGTGGFKINLIWDAAALAAPAAFRTGIQNAAQQIANEFTDKITVNIKIDYSGTGGGAAAGPDSGYYESYALIRSDLVNNASPGITYFNSLPTGSSIQGQTNVAVWNAQLKLYGIIGSNDTTTDDGSATFATDINSNLLVGVAYHELTHALGRSPTDRRPTSLICPAILLRARGCSPDRSRLRPITSRLMAARPSWPTTVEAPIPATS